MGIYWRNGWAHGKVKRGGVPHRRSFRTKDPETAEIRHSAWIKELDAKRAGVALDGEHTVREAVNKFIDEHMPLLKKRAVERYATSLKWLLPFFGTMKLRDVSSKDLSAFEAKRRKMRPRKRSKAFVSPITVKRDLACLSSIFSSAEEWEWVKYNPVKPYIRGRTKKGVMVENEGRRRYLSHEEENLLLMEIDVDDYDRFAFAIDTGLRADEQWNITKSDIDRKKKRVFVRKEIAKSSRDRWVPLMPRAWEIVERRLKNNQSDFIFWRKNDEDETIQVEHTWAWRRFQAVLTAKEIKDVEWHDLRRTCGCRLLQDHRMPMKRVSVWLGHSRVEVTEKHYAFLQVEDLEAAIDPMVAPAARKAVVDAD